LFHLSVISCLYDGLGLSYLVMRIPLTKYGWPQLVFLPIVVLVIMAFCLLAELPGWVVILAEAALAVILIWILSFFRDPYRQVPADKNILLAPADGRITGIEAVEKNDFIGGPAIKFGIFLSIFDVHINRAPCNAKVERIIYKKGLCKNAMNPLSGQLNESNDLVMVRLDSPQDRLLVRQISGAIARRIVCAAGEGQKLAGGERFGMIKFGSRTELYLAARENAKPLVKAGDKVKAGLTPLVRYE